MADTLGKKISELEATTDLQGLYTIGTNKNTESKKVSLQFLKEAADYANAQGDYAKGVGDNVAGNTGISDYPVFNPAVQYAAGSVVNYSGRLYRFTRIHAAGAWVGTDAELTSINEEAQLKLTELESVFTLKGEGDPLITKRFYGFLEGKKYLVMIENTDIPINEITHPDYYDLFNITARDKSDNALSTLVKVYLSEKLSSQYIITIPEGIDHIRVAGRCNAGANIKLSITYYDESVNDNFDKMESFIINSNNGLQGIFVEGESIVIKNDGFRIDIAGVPYYIGYKEGVDAEREAKFSYIDGYTASFLYLDTSKLIAEKRVAVSEALRMSNVELTNNKYILLAAWNQTYEAANSVTYVLNIIGKLANIIASERNKVTKSSFELHGEGNALVTERFYGCIEGQQYLILIENDNVFTNQITHPSDYDLFNITARDEAGNNVGLLVKVTLAEKLSSRYLITIPKGVGAASIRVAGRCNVGTSIKVSIEYHDNTKSPYVKALAEKTIGILEPHNNTYGNITISGNKLIISENGLHYIGEDGLDYYIGYVAGVDENTEYIVEGKEEYYRAYLILDLSALVAGKRIAFSKAFSFVETTTFMSEDKYVLVAMWTKGILQPKGLLSGNILEQMRGESEAQLNNEKINEDILFAPQFYAYKMGRYNNEWGLGTGWYKRFSIVHISDTHGYNGLVGEACRVASKKANLLVNTGDDGSNTLSEHAPYILAALQNSINEVKNNLSIPFLEVKGNHDVPGLTRKQYFDIVCSTIQQYTKNVVWGNAEEYCSYGYADFIDGDHEGNFRIVMLDPFDYADGQFETIYPHQCAVFSQKQIEWLIGTLVDAANNNLHVLTMMHYSFGDAPSSNPDVAKPDANFYQDPFMIPDIIDAIQHKSILKKTYTDKAGYNNIVIDEDFSAVGDLDFVAHIFGHIHSKNEYQCKRYDGTKKYDILMLGEAALGTYGNALNKAYRYEGTINEIAFSALSIDPIEKAVYRVAYGSFLNYDKSNGLSDRTMKIPYRFEL